MKERISIAVKMHKGNMFSEDKKIIIKPENSVFSGHELVIIPLDIKFKPSKDQIQNTLDILKKEYPKCEITSEVYDSVEFVDQGQNFESVKCNHCNTELAIDYWQERMSESYEVSHFEDMNFTIHCCQKKTNLNMLLYLGDCGFASYRISVNNPEFNEKKEINLKKILTKSLGAEIKIFWKHI